MAIRICKKCKKEKDLEDFPIYDRANNRRRHECKSCNTARVEGWHTTHKEERLAKCRARYHDDPTYAWTPERRARTRDLSKIRYEKIRNEVFDRHGSECVACGETERLFLTIDHINNDGWQLRKTNGYRESGVGLYLDILRYGMREDLEILCFNCNFGKRRNGGVLLRDCRTREGATTRTKVRRAKRPEAPGPSQEGDDIVSSARKLAAA